MKRWVIAAVAVSVLGLLSMGFLGVFLYYAVYPVFAPWYGNLDDWRGDNVWPAVIAAGMLWPLSFPVAGWVDRRLRGAGRGRGWRFLACAAVLWLGIVLVWAWLLATMEIRFFGG